MHKILIFNKFNQQEIIYLPGIPRVGDHIPTVYIPTPKVTSVTWMPELIYPELEGSGVEVIVVVV